MPDRRRALLAYLQGLLTQTLRLAAPPDVDTGVSELGMDSLMALQLKSLLESRLGVEDALPATIAFDTGTVEALAEHLYVLVSPREAVLIPVTRESSVTISAEALSQYSDAEVEALLAERLRADSKPVGPS